MDRIRETRNKEREGGRRIEEESEEGRESMCMYMHVHMYYIYMYIHYTIVPRDIIMVV